MLGVSGWDARIIGARPAERKAGEHLFGCGNRQSR
jgi:hypothetical protein